MRLILVVVSLLVTFCGARAEPLSVWIGMASPRYGEKEGIYRATLDSDAGTLSKPELAAELAAPGYLALHPEGSRLYALCTLPNGESGVAAFEIRGERQSLRWLNAQPIGDGEACHLALDREARCLFTAQYGTGSVCVFPLLADGTIGARTAHVRHTGSGPNRSRQEGPHPHWVGTDAANRFLFVPDLGTDEIVIYRLDPANAEIAAHGHGHCSPGAGPRHMKFHPNGRFAYVVNELELSVTAFRYDANADQGTHILAPFQTATTLPEELREGADSGSAIRVHPSGKFLYAANRGHDSIAAFAIDHDTGRLTFIERESVRGSHPRDFNIDPTGKWLLAAGRDSNTISLFQIDAESGALRYTGKTVNSPAPICVAIKSSDSIAPASASAKLDPEVESLIAKGEYTKAEKLLKQQIADPHAPVTSQAATRLEVLRRTRQDFPFTDAQIKSQLKASIPDISQDEIDRWRAAGQLQARSIDGEPRYFRAAVANLFRASDEARRRRSVVPPPPKKFDLNALIVELVQLSSSSKREEVYPVEHQVRYTLEVKEGHPRLKHGATVRAWLPFPQEYRQQRNVKLIRSEPPHQTIAQNGVPHRTIYFEETVADPGKPPRFSVEFKFTTSAYFPMLDAAKVKPYDVAGALYHEYTAERPPHIVFTPEVKQLAAEIVGDETNPLEKARLVFRWVSKNIPWCSEMEYSIIPSLSQKGLKARRGDCGVQGLVFITLCRAARVPARWQSGWQTKPGDWNMHDWSEFYVEPWGWLPADASYGVRDHADPRVRDFLCGHIDPYRLIVNLDYARPLDPPKTSFRSEPNDFQRGEIEIDGHNLYFDEWDYTFDAKTTPLRRRGTRGQNSR